MCKHVVPATLFASAMALPAQAITVITDDGPYGIAPSSDFFIGSVTGNGGAGQRSIEFSPSVSGTFNASLNVILTSTRASFFDDLSVEWVFAPGLSASGPAPLPAGQTNLATTFTGGVSQFLVFSWTNSLNALGFQFDVSPSPTTVPVPAGILLLGTALAGFGFAWTRKGA